MKRFRSVMLLIVAIVCLYPISLVHAGKFDFRDADRCGDSAESVMRIRQGNRFSHSELLVKIDNNSKLSEDGRAFRKIMCKDIWENYDKSSDCMYVGKILDDIKFIYGDIYSNLDHVPSMAEIKFYTDEYQKQYAILHPPKKVDTVKIYGFTSTRWGLEARQVMRNRLSDPDSKRKKINIERVSKKRVNSKNLSSKQLEIIVSMYDDAYTYEYDQKNSKQLCRNFITKWKNKMSNEQ